MCGAFSCSKGSTKLKDTVVWEPRWTRFSKPGEPAEQERAKGGISHGVGPRFPNQMSKTKNRRAKWLRKG